MIRSRALMAATAFAAFTGVNAFAADAVPTETFKVLTGAERKTLLELLKRLEEHVAAQA